MAGAGAAINLDNAGGAGRLCLNTQLDFCNPPLTRERMEAPPMKMISLVILVLLLAPLSRASTNGLGLTPPMGYNSWYINHGNINESFIRKVADTMATNGLREAGYEYICLDDGWASGRDTNGTIVASPVKFPSGMKALGDYLHAKGFKFGIYSAWGPFTCEGLPGSCGHVVQDANTYAAWGVDYLKYDACSSCPPQTDYRQDVELMAAALLQCGRPIFFNSSIDVYHPAPGWAPSVLNTWRGTGDILPSFDVLLYHLDYVARTPELAGPGHWNDPDVLQVGRLVTIDQAKVDFGMWCMLAAPLLLEDYAFTPAVMQLLTNREVIAVNQDAAGIQGVCVATNGSLQVWRKPLGTNGVIAVALLNRGETADTITANWSDLGLPAGPVAVRDLWARAYVGDFTNSYTAYVPKHGVQLVRIVPNTRIAPPPAGTNFLSTLPWLAGSSNAFALRLNQNAAGNPMRLHGTLYTNGLGVRPYSLTTYWLGGAATRFRADIGLDDEACCNSGSVVFRVWADGVKLHDSGVITSASPVQTVDVDLTGRSVLALEVTDAGDGAVNDLADWGSARIVVPPLPPAVPAMLGAAPAPDRIALSWYASSGAQSYVLKRALASNGPYEVVATPAIPAFADANVLRDTVYYYIVAAVNDFGTGVYSAPIACSLPAYWTGTGPNAVQNWNVVGNWTNTAGFPNAVGRTAVINAGLAAGQTINLNQVVTAGSLAIGDRNGSAAYTIAANDGALAFDNGPGPAFLTQLATSRGDILAAPISVPSRLVVSNLSSWPLTFSGSNSVSGEITFARGVLKAGNTSALGYRQGTVTISAGAALDLGGMNLASTGITVSGAGPQGAGAIVNDSAGQPASLGFVTLNGDAVFGGTADWSIRGRLAFPATLSTGGNSYNLIKAGSNQLSLASVAMDAALGDIDVRQGTLRLESATALGDPSQRLVVEQGATLAFNNSISAWNKNFVLNGDGATPAMTNASGNSTVSGPVTLSGDCVIAAGSPLFLQGPVTGPGALIKSASGALALSGTNLYTGKTLVTAGSLALTGSGSMDRSVHINVAAGAVLDGSGHDGGGFGVANGQTLDGRGVVKGDCTIGAGATLAQGDPAGMLAFSNALTVAPGGTLVLGVAYPPASNSPMRVGGILTCGGELILANLGTNQPALGDSLQVFQAGGFAGAVDAVLPRIPGPGLLWDTSGLGQSGVLRVISGTLPQITSELTDQTFSIRGNGGTFGTPGRACCLLNGTNAALPMYLWECVATNQLDAGGNFSFSLPVDTARRSSFYSVQLR
jgi:alpha-galactosidase